MSNISQIPPRNKVYEKDIIHFEQQRNYEVLIRLGFPQRFGAADEWCRSLAVF